MKPPHRPILIMTVVHRENGRSDRLPLAYPDTPLRGPDDTYNCQLLDGSGTLRDWLNRHPGYSAVCYEASK